MAAPTDPKAVAPLLRMLNAYQGSFIVACALRLAPLVFLRPGELRQAEWAGVDLENGEWRYLVPKTKTEHLVPLSRQSVAILRELHQLTGNGRYVFPSSRSASRPMSNNTVNAAMRRMGIDTQNELTGHGFRQWPTILDEVGFRPIHRTPACPRCARSAGRAYNRTARQAQKMIRHGRIGKDCCWRGLQYRADSGCEVTTVMVVNICLFAG